MIASGSRDVLPGGPVFHQQHPAIESPVLDRFEVGGRDVGKRRLTARVTGERRRPPRGGVVGG
ncbi:hypothetical protein ACFY05_35405 [Microtetraspora fusca]|uniref:Uncharacterized protein n=1 Tax=Microtetraspora fusca TaxID=1997 RepID=A0ABW6VHP8_MICFU